MIKVVLIVIIGAIVISAVDAALGIHMDFGPRIVHQGLTMTYGIILFHFASRKDNG